MIHLALHALRLQRYKKKMKYATNKGAFFFEQCVFLIESLANVKNFLYLCAENDANMK